MFKHATKYTAKLTVSVTFPLVILFNILFLANEFSLLFLTTGVLLLNFSHIVFSYKKKLAKLNGGFRILLFFAIIVSFGLGFTFLFPNLNYYAFNSFRVGWIVGLFVVIYLSIQFLVGRIDDRKTWLFESGEVRYGQTLIKYWAFFIAVFLFSYLVFITFFSNQIGPLIFLLNFAICAVSLIITGLNYGIRLRFNEKSQVTDVKFLMGASSILGALIILSYPYTNIPSILLFVIGFSLIMSVITNEEIYKKYLIFVSLPSFLMIFLFFFLSTNFFEVNAYLATSGNGESAKELIQKKSLIKNQMDKLYQEMVAKGNLSKYINPQFSIKIINPPSIWHKPELNLELKYSYELINPVFADSVRYFKPGRYKLKEGNVAYAIAESFKISINDYLNEYFQLDRRVEIMLKGTADKLPIINTLVYRGEYDYFFRSNKIKMIWEDQLIPVNFKRGDIIDDNFHLAALRAISVRDYINKNVTILQKNTEPEYQYFTHVDFENAGGEFRKVEIILKIYNIIPSTD